MRYIRNSMYRVVGWYSFQRANFHQLWCEVGPGQADLLLAGVAVIPAVAVTGLIRISVILLF